MEIAKRSEKVLKKLGIAKSYFCKGYNYGEKSRFYQWLLESKKKNVGNRTFFRDNLATIILKKD